jgi:hypothetical protein
MRDPQAGHDLLRTGAVRRRLDAGDEAAFLDDQFVVDGNEDSLGHGRQEGGRARHGESGHAHKKKANPKVGVFILIHLCTTNSW